MRPFARPVPVAALAALLCLAIALPAQAGRRRRAAEPRHEPAGSAVFTSPQANPIAVAPGLGRVYVANTTSGTVSVLDAGSGNVVATVEVGLDPVSVAVRPDEAEVWVANHVSDSVSVIDTGSNEVVATIQDLDGFGVTRFDEPVGIAFASSSKAFVALSSTNQIAVVDVSGPDYTVRSTRIPITAQEPRAIAVRNGNLYVAAFESSNQTEISACPNGGSAPQCTLDQGDLQDFVTEPNIPGAIKNVVVDPDLPDRDVFVFDASDPQSTTPSDVISGVGTLLYGLAVDSSGVVYVTQTDARNDVNGIESDLPGPPNGPEGDVNGDGNLDLADLQGRMFLNQVARIDCSGGGSCSFSAGSDVSNLGEEAPGTPVTTPLATPYGVALTGDDSALVVTAAASSRLATVDATTLLPVDTLDLAGIPRGVAFLPASGSDRSGTAYVLQTLGNSVAVVDVDAGGNLSLQTVTFVGSDPTPPEVRRGRVAFNDAGASDSGTFACASCHPDGNTDQLLWRIGGECFGSSSGGESSLDECVPGQDEARSTMPVRGLRNTLPLHWDGTLGDPFGGGNGAYGNNGNPPIPVDCSETDQHGCFVDLVGESLAGVMCDQTGASGSCDPFNPRQLSSTEVDDMGSFLDAVSYPPARERAVTDVVSPSAFDGFADFTMDQGGIGGQVASCADNNAGCHALPLGVDTNSSTLNGFDVPTMRGLNDRFLQFSLGVTAAEENQVTAQGANGCSPDCDWDPSVGYDEFTVFAVAFPAAFSPIYGVEPDDIFQMVQEGSTGHSGAAGRQVTIDTVTTNPPNDAFTLALLGELEAADERGVVNLRGSGVHNGQPVTITYHAGSDTYRVGPNDLPGGTGAGSFWAEAQVGTVRGTLTAHLRRNAGTHAQPVIGPVPGSGGTGDPPLPVLEQDGTGNPMGLSAEDVRGGASILMDGDPVGGTVGCLFGNGFDPICGGAQGEALIVTLDSIPSNGMHLLQIQNQDGLLSNELPICVTQNGTQNQIDQCL